MPFSPLIITKGYSEQVLLIRLRLHCPLLDFKTPDCMRQDRPDLSLGSNTAKRLKEVQGSVQDYPELDPKQLWEERMHHRSCENEELDLNELDFVAGGATRECAKEGCAVTVEIGSWCWSNDQCAVLVMRVFEFCMM